MSTSRRYGLVLGLLVLLYLMAAPAMQSASSGKKAGADAANNAALLMQVQQTPAPATYSVVGPPTVSADFINRVLAAYGSPTAGKGQTLYDLGVKYGIDPVYALAFFLHESSMGTTGEARVTMSLGNERCIPDRACIDQDRGGYAQMHSWEDGFEQWYKLIRDLYVTTWGRRTVDQIIPKYAPASDNNDEAAYIAALKYEVDHWRAGEVVLR